MDTFFPTRSTSLTAAVASAVVRVAVITEHNVSPTIIHKIQNIRAITDLGALSPYLKTDKVKTQRVILYFGYKYFI